MEGINVNGDKINTKIINININGIILRTIITNGRAQSYFIEGIPRKLTDDAKAINISGKDLSENILDTYDSKKIIDTINNGKKTINIKINGKSIKTIDIHTDETEEKIINTTDETFEKDGDIVYTIDIKTFTKSDIIDDSDVKGDDNEIDITPIKVEIDNRNTDGIKNLDDNIDVKTIDVVDENVKLDITDGLGFLNYIIFAHRTRAPNNKKEP